MSSNQDQIHEVLPGGPDPQRNVTGSGDQVGSDGTFVQGRVVDREPFATPTRAEDTMTGATSGDVHGGIGQAWSGMTSAEMRHDGQHGRKEEGFGGEQWGQGDAREQTGDIEL